MSVVLDEMKTRRSIRKFKPDMVPADVLTQEELVDALLKIKE